MAEKTYQKELESITENFNILIKKARSGVVMAQEKLAFLLYGCIDNIENQLLPQAEDASWLLDLARKGNFNALYVYINAKKRTYSDVWIEKFLDKESGKVYDIQRRDLLESIQVFDVTEEQAVELIRNYFDLKMKRLDDMDVLEMAALVRNIQNRLDFRGINSDRCPQFLKLLHRLIEKDGSTWYENLGELYYFGCPKIGIYRDAVKGRGYFAKCDVDLASLPQTAIDEDAVCNRVITFKGAREKLEAIEAVVKTLCERLGDVDCEHGMHVPLKALMKLLVGSDEYYGNVLYMDLHDDALKLTVEGEVDSIEAMQYAFNELFGPFEIEVEGYVE